MGDRGRVKGAPLSRRLGHLVEVGVASEVEPPEQNPRDPRVMTEKSREEGGIVRGSLW